MFEIASFFTKFDAAFIIAPLIFSLIYLIRSRNVNNIYKSVQTASFAIFIIYISFEQTLFSILAYTKSQNIFIIKSLFPFELFFLSFIVHNFLNNGLKKSISFSILTGLVGFILAYYSGNEMPVASFLFGYIITFIISLNCLTIITIPKIELPILKALMAYCISGILFASLHHTIQLEAFTISALLGIYSKFLFITALNKLMEVSWI